MLSSRVTKLQNWDAALLNEMVSTTPTLEAPRATDMYSCFEGNAVQVRDVEQAYLQAEMEGPPVYVQLPEDLWTPRMCNMLCPVVRLKKALYGHKTAVCVGRDIVISSVRRRDSNQFRQLGPNVYYEHFFF